MLRGNPASVWSELGHVAAVRSIATNTSKFSVLHLTLQPIELPAFTLTTVFPCLLRVLALIDLGLTVSEDPSFYTNICKHSP
jgi:hypothetical protein